MAELTPEEMAIVKGFVAQLFERSGKTRWRDFADLADVSQGMAYDWKAPSGSAPNALNLMRLMAAAGLLTEELMLPGVPEVSGLRAELARRIEELRREKRP